MVDRDFFFITFLLVIFFLLPSGNEAPHNGNEQEALSTWFRQRQTNQKQMAALEPWQGYGNLTGFQLLYQDWVDGKNQSDYPLHEFSPDHPFHNDNQRDSILPDKVLESVRQWWAADPLLPYLLNISGSADGHWATAHYFKRVPLEMPKYVQKFYEEYTQRKYDEEKQRYDNDPDLGTAPERPQPPVQKVGNMSVDHGKVSLQFLNRDYNYKWHPKTSVTPIDDAVPADVRVYLKDEGDGDANAIYMLGVYFQDLGLMVAVTDLAKFMGPYALPQLLFGGFNRSQALVNEYLNYTNNDDALIDQLRLAALGALEQCEFVGYFQLAPAEYSRDELREIDDELARPVGRPLPRKLPPLEVSQFLLYLPDCGVAYALDGLVEGTKTLVAARGIRHMLAGFLVLMFAQLGLYLRQMRHMRTPGQLLTVLARTLFMLAYQNTLVTIGFWLLLLVYGDIYLVLAGVLVVSFTCGILDLRFMTLVLMIQVNEQGISWWNILRGGTREQREDEADVEAGGDAAGGEGGQAEPEPAPGPGFGLSSEEAGLFNSVVGLCLFSALVTMFVGVNVIGWRYRYRKIAEYLFVLITNLYWIPQFLRNTLKNRRQAFSWEFVVGILLIRIICLAYLCLYRNNPLRHAYDPMEVAITTAWLITQWLLLYLQKRLGARFWIHDKFLPKAFDYQPTITMLDLELNFSLDVLEGIKLGDDEPAPPGIVNCQCMCPICMTLLTLPVVKDPQVAPTNIHKDYMITPCHHIFHAECLELWMKYKLQCPVCRLVLPPI